MVQAGPSHCKPEQFGAANRALETSSLKKISKIIEPNRDFPESSRLEKTSKIIEFNHDL